MTFDGFRGHRSACAIIRDPNTADCYSESLLVVGAGCIPRISLVIRIPSEGEGGVNDWKCGPNVRRKRVGKRSRSATSQHHSLTPLIDLQF
jgi:hypothetical protein